MLVNQGKIQTQSWLFNPLNTELNPICQLLALLEAHHILHISRIRVNIYFFYLIVIVLYGTMQMQFFLWCDVIQWQGVMFLHNIAVSFMWFTQCVVKENTSA